MAVSKSEKAFRTITEVADILQLPAHVLRFWESKFKYIKPMKRGGGRRYYRPEDIDLLLGIKYLLYSKGLTIKGAQKTIQTCYHYAQEVVRPEDRTVCRQSLFFRYFIGSRLSFRIQLQVSGRRAGRR